MSSSMIDVVVIIVVVDGGVDDTGMGLMMVSVGDEEMVRVALCFGEMRKVDGSGMIVVVVDEYWLTRIIIWRLES
jgi:hypothetical protein